MQGKVALVTGASRGIGRSIALTLAEAGADVVINYVSNEASAQEVVQQIQNMGRQAIAIQASVGQYDQAELLVESAMKRFGKCDVLVNNAGIARDNLLIRMKESEFDQVIETNLKGTFNMIKLLSKFMMKARSGNIINISSVVGVLGNAGQTNYAATKAGVIGLTKSAARELAARNIRVNCVAPGFIETDMTENLNQDAFLNTIPLKRLGKPQEVAQAVLFLASDQSAYMTGQTLHVDGGMYM